MDTEGAPKSRQEIIDNDPVLKDLNAQHKAKSEEMALATKAGDNKVIARINTQMEALMILWERREKELGIYRPREIGKI